MFIFSVSRFFVQSSTDVRFLRKKTKFSCWVSCFVVFLAFLCHLQALGSMDMFFLLFRRYNSCRITCAFFCGINISWYDKFALPLEDIFEQYLGLACDYRYVCLAARAASWLRSFSFCVTTYSYSPIPNNSANLEAMSEKYLWNFL